MAHKQLKNGSQNLPGKTTKPGVIPNQKKLPVPGSGRGKPARGYNPKTGEWNQK